MATSKSSTKKVTVVDSGAFDCGVCESPLKPPIFQCEVGHMVCSECSEKMAAAEACHVCRRTLSGGYKRCYGAEHIVESLKVPCPNKAYGCSVKLARYDESGHLEACKYRPFHGPAEGCTFVIGKLESLRNHFVSKHGWPSSKLYAGTANLVLVDGLNVIEPYPWPTEHLFGFGDADSIWEYLVLLKVTRESYGRVVTPIHIRPRNAKKCRMKLVYETPCRTNRLGYAFNVASTDLSTSTGLSFDDCFEFVVPKSVQTLDSDTIKVAVRCWYLDEISSPKP